MLFRNNQKLILVVGLILSISLLAGCAPQVDHTMTTENLLEGNFWERNVVYYFALTLDTFANWFGGIYVLAILLLTIVVRTLILPLTLKQYRSSKAMQALQPQITELRNKHKDNPQKMQEEMMKLYQVHNVNPLAGCLPLIVQMPVFIALYNAIYWNENIRSSHLFGWTLNETSPWYFLPLIAAATTFIQTKMMQSTQQQQMPGMSILLGVFPIMIFVMSLSFPMALPLYWVFSNLYTIIQNYFLYVLPNRKGKGKEKKEVLAK